MSATPFDSAHLHRLFPAGDLAKLFSDSAEVRAIMIVAGTLAKVQGEAGLIPETAAKAIHRASLELQIDPGALAHGTAEAGSAVPPLLHAFQSLMQAPDYAQYLGQGAFPGDLQDCALALRLRQVLAQLEAKIEALPEDSDLAAFKAELPALRAGLLCVSYEGDRAEILRPALGAALNLSDQGWGPKRTAVTTLAEWAARLVRAL
ncbi:adenylosuccinate lyase family protein, partial [Yangia mangrovi]|nr:adenylosuccinate lyase family protein [Alloyangia mangrovi]